MTLRILRINARCPECAAPPRLRTFPEGRDLFDGRDPDQVVQTYQCHMRKCRAIYEIRVRDFQEAS